MSLYWQHHHPLRCPNGHEMVWLGSLFWICNKRGCKTIYVQTPWKGKPRIRLHADASIDIFDGERPSP